MNQNANPERASSKHCLDPKTAVRWAIILAGGDGKRLRPLTEVIAGDGRPKQFCSILGNETLLAQTRRRAALAVQPPQTLFALTRTHERFYNSLLKDVSDRQLVIQPQNAGTAPAILYSLLRLSHLDPTATVVLLPSDHYVSDDDAFATYVESAFESVRLREDLVVLLGIKPEGPETEYGWIEPVSRGLVGNPDTLSWVRRFWEKPRPEFARVLMKRGCLWNSFVMVGKVSAFLRMIQQTTPELLSRFRAIEPCFDTPDEEKSVRELYGELPDVSFSQDVLAARPTNLAVLPVTGLAWNDLGRPERVVSTMTELASQKAYGPTVNLAGIPASAY